MDFAEAAMGGEKCAEACGSRLVSLRLLDPQSALFCNYGKQHIVAPESSRKQLGNSGLKGGPASKQFPAADALFVSCWQRGGPI